MRIKKIIQLKIIVDRIITRTVGGIFKIKRLINKLFAHTVEKNIIIRDLHRILKTKIDDPISGILQDLSQTNDN